MNTVDHGESARVYDKKRPQYVLAELLLSHLSQIHHKKFLDVGCGFGEFIDILKGHQVTNVVGIDGSDTCYAFSLKKGVQCYKVNLEEGQLPFANESFDVVVSLEVIEHLWNTKHYLSEIHRVLRRQGSVILTTPNYNYYRYRIMHLFGSFEKFTYKSRHKKFYTLHSFKKEVSAFFEVRTLVSTNSLPLLGMYVNKGQNHFLTNLLAFNVGILGIKK